MRNLACLLITFAALSASAALASAVDAQMPTLLDTTVLGGAPSRSLRSVQALRLATLAPGTAQARDSANSCPGLRVAHAGLDVASGAVLGYVAFKIFTNNRATTDGEATRYMMSGASAGVILGVIDAIRMHCFEGINGPHGRFRGQGPGPVPPPRHGLAPGPATGIMGRLD